MHALMASEFSKGHERNWRQHTHTQGKKTYPSKQERPFSAGKDYTPHEKSYSELRMNLPPTIHRTFHIRKAWWCPWPTKHRGVPGVYAHQIRRCSDHFLRFSLWVCLTIYGPWETSEIFRNPLGHHGSSAFALLIDRHNLWYNPL
jgi:hypothetical protein